jgi:UPF0716 protein FxsA
MPLTMLPFLLLLVPILEIGTFIIVGGEIGVLWTVLLILFTAVLGSILLRIQGFRTFAQIRGKMNSGEIPGKELVNGAMILVAGVLLLTPGFITDFIGFALFVPVIRNVIWGFLSRRFIVSDIGGMGNRGFDNRDKTTHSPTDPKVVDLDPDDFHDDANSKSPWFSSDNDKDRSN